MQEEGENSEGCLPAAAVPGATAGPAACGNAGVDARKQPVCLYTRLVKGFIDLHNEDGSGSFSLPVALSK